MKRSYFVLCTRESATDHWAPQFGDFDRDVVIAEEVDCYTSESFGGYAKRDRRIIKVNGARQQDIDAAIAKLNGGTP